MSKVSDTCAHALNAAKTDTLDRILSDSGADLTCEQALRLGSSVWQMWTGASPVVLQWGFEFGRCGQSLRLWFCNGVGSSLVKCVQSQRLPLRNGK